MTATPTEDCYDINIAKLQVIAKPGVPYNLAKTTTTYRHFFRVYVRGTDRQRFKDVIDSLRVAYPAPGYSIDVAFWTIRGETVHEEEIL